MSKFVFVVDSSVSMHQRTENGMTLLDCAKSAIEYFVKLRQQKGGSKNDRYWLVSSEPGQTAIKAAWRDSMKVFLHELKNLKAHDLTDMASPFKHVFDMLNMYRVIHGVDNPGMGRLPHRTDQAIIVIFTDGGFTTTRDGIADEFKIPSARYHGHDLFHEPFRWDQRIYTIVLRMPGTSHKPPVETHRTAAGRMSDVTGGKYFQANSMKSLLHCIEQIFPIQHAVQIHFDVFEHQSVDRRQVKGSALLFNYPHAGQWPLPDAFWPDQKMRPERIKRRASPTLYVNPVDTDPKIPHNFPFDKYEISSCALTKYMLKRSTPAAWQVFLLESGQGGGHGAPCGYIKTSSNGMTVRLFVLPYNYPKLFPLIEQLMQCKMSPAHAWVKEFEKYLRTIPIYYLVFVREALKKLGAPTTIVAMTEKLERDSAYLTNIKGYVKDLQRKARAENERVLNNLTKARLAKEQASEGGPVQAASAPTVSSAHASDTGSSTSELADTNYQHILSTGLSLETAPGGDASGDVDLNADMPIQRPSTPERPWSPSGSDPGLPVLDDTGLLGHAPPPIPGAKSNQTETPFDVSRSSLLSWVCEAAAGRGAASASRFNLPINEMGNYQEAMQRRDPLRDVHGMDVQPVFFGNPYRLKQSDLGIDEADEGAVNQHGRRIGKKRSRSRSRSPSIGKKVPKLVAHTTPSGSAARGKTEGFVPTLRRTSSASPRASTGGGPPPLNIAASSTPPPSFGRPGQKVSPNTQARRAAPRKQENHLATNAALKLFAMQELKKTQPDVEKLSRRLGRELNGGPSEKKAFLADVIAQAQRLSKPAVVTEIESALQKISDDLH